MRPGNASRPSTPPGLRHRQARQPLRRGHRRHACSEAYEKAFKTDPTSAFGGIIAFNGEVDASTWSEAVAASSSSKWHHRPGLTAEARPPMPPSRTCACWSCRQVSRPQRAGLQARRRRPAAADADDFDRPGDIKVVTKVRRPRSRSKDLLFAWRVAKFVKSNAIVFCKDGMTWASAPAR
jgi:phosphoribosylaminoimidazolecarboxamide formyltransferase/IMP cyclohydrolase